MNLLPKASKSNEFNERKFFRSRQQYPLMSAIVAHDTTKTEVKRIIRYFFYSLFICSEKSPERNGKSERKTIEVLSKMWSERKAYVVFGARARSVQLIFCNISKLTKTYNAFWRFTDFPSCYNIVYLLEWMFKILLQCQLLYSLCSIEMFYLISINNRTCLKYECWMNTPNAKLCGN